jgi:hypothetical protein
MQLTEQHVIERNDPRFAIIDAAFAFSEREEISTERREASNVTV